MSEGNILTETRERVGLMTLNRPKVRNALNSAVMSEIVQALQKFEADANVGAVVITGNPDAFAAGADIKEMAGRSAVEMLTADTISAWDELRNFSKPLIAAVSGWCLGGGCELAMACDLIIASETARFGQPELLIGVMPGAGGTQRLTKAVGKAVAMEVVLNGRNLTAEEAERFGLVNHVYPVELYLQEALRIAHEIADRAPVAVRLAKEAVLKSFETGLEEGIEYERRLFYFLFATQDQGEGMRAFLEKRKPQWRGR